MNLHVACGACTNEECIVVERSERLLVMTCRHMHVWISCPRCSHALARAITSFHYTCWGCKYELILTGKP